MRPCSDETCLKSYHERRNKARFYKERRLEGNGSEMINTYNEKLLRLWRGNMDLTFVGN